MKDTSLRLLLSSLFCCSTNAAARLTVTPSSSQVFENEVVSLRCEDASEGWTVRRNTGYRNRAECEVDWGRSDGFSCTISPTDPVDSGEYWCESTEGSTSNNITITISEKPPTTTSDDASEGNLKLLKWKWKKTSHTAMSGYPRAGRSQPDRADEAENSGSNETEESDPAAVYSEVKTKRDVCYGEITINTNRRRDAEVEMGEDVTYSDVKTSQSRKKPIKKSRRGRESDPAAVYSEVKTKRDVSYGEIVINTNRRRVEIVPEPDVLYSSLK
ncbi:hypothetical protein JOQ06_021153 [Pogonophryne albipinna]|uniref:Ig-like domain-containing protein n=1 Tax=Pogonophryne albipinna TaxID=1090488 RepID=A0AAD6BSB7_9TELE|nr:hypothetical protein JOQ06_021153 [Pogonophryne albipinna]